LSRRSAAKAEALPREMPPKNPPHFSSIGWRRRAGDEEAAARPDLGHLVAPMPDVGGSVRAVPHSENLAFLVASERSEDGSLRPFPTTPWLSDFQFLLSALEWSSGHGAKTRH
jgi:hypothetical protein